MMKNLIQIQSAARRSIRILTVICGLMMPMALLSCIKEQGRDECNYESLLYIVIETENADFESYVDGATIYLFNSDGTYHSSVQVSADDIANNVPVKVSYARDNLLRAVVWGNTGVGTEIGVPAAGAVMENIYVSMVRDAGGNAVPADNLFYGSKQLSGEAVEEIVISPKTGILAVTARGIWGSPTDRYFYTVDIRYDRYDFLGTPLSGEAVVNIDGEFQDADLIMPGLCHLFHFPTPVPAGEHLTIRLYRIREGVDEPILLATAETDTNGDPIAILRERITNVLINISEGGIEVIVRVTDWGEIHQWNIW